MDFYLNNYKQLKTTFDNVKAAIDLLIIINSQGLTKTFTN